jgi:hypothetical protein
MERLESLSRTGDETYSSSGDSSGGSAGDSGDDDEPVSSLEADFDGTPAVSLPQPSTQASISFFA